MNYKVLITFDPEYKGYVIDFSKIPGNMSQGKTIVKHFHALRMQYRAGFLFKINMNNLTE